VDCRLSMFGSSGSVRGIWMHITLSMMLIYLLELLSMRWRKYIGGWGFLVVWVYGCDPSSMGQLPCGVCSVTNAFTVDSKSCISQENLYVIVVKFSMLAWFLKLVGM